MKEMDKTDLSLERHVNVSLWIMLGRVFKDKASVGKGTREKRTISSG